MLQLESRYEAGERREQHFIAMGGKAKHIRSILRVSKWQIPDMYGVRFLIFGDQVSLWGTILVKEIILHLNLYWKDYCYTCLLTFMFLTVTIPTPHNNQPLIDLLSSPGSCAFVIGTQK